MDEVAILTVRVDKRYPNLSRPQAVSEMTVGACDAQKGRFPAPSFQEHCCWRPG